MHRESRYNEDHNKSACTMKELRHLQCVICCLMLMWRRGAATALRRHHQGALCASGNSCSGNAIDKHDDIRSGPAGLLKELLISYATCCNASTGATADTCRIWRHHDLIITDDRHLLHSHLRQKGGESQRRQQWRSSCKWTKKLDGKGSNTSIQPSAAILCVARAFRCRACCEPWHSKVGGRVLTGVIEVGCQTLGLMLPDCLPNLMGKNTAKYSESNTPFSRSTELPDQKHNKRAPSQLQTVL